MKYLNRIITVLLLISLASALFSCRNGNYEDGGPGTGEADLLDTYVMGYDEMVEIYNLRKNNPEIRDSPIPYIDSKDSGINVRFVAAVEKNLGKSDNERDYLAKSGCLFRCCIFLDEVPAEEHIYLDYEYLYDCLTVKNMTGKKVEDPAGAEDINIYYAGMGTGGMQIYEVFYNGRVQFSFERYRKHGDPLSEEELAQFEDKLALLN